MGNLGEDRRVEQSFQIRRSANRVIGEFAGDRSAASGEGAQAERHCGEQQQVRTGRLIRRRYERGTDHGEIAGVEALEYAGLLEPAEEGRVQRTALAGFLAGEAQGYSIAGELRGEILLLGEGVASGGFRIERNLIVGVGAFTKAVDLLADRGLNALQSIALFDGGWPILAVAIGGFGDLTLQCRFLRAEGRGGRVNSGCSGRH